MQSSGIWCGSNGKHPLPPISHQLHFIINKETLPLPHFALHSRQGRDISFILYIWYTYIYTHQRPHLTSNTKFSRKYHKDTVGTFKHSCPAFHTNETSPPPPPPPKKNAQKKLKNRCAIASKSLRKLVYPWPALSVCGQTGTHELKNDHPWEPWDQL